MILYGAGGHAKNIVDNLKSQGMQPIAIIDDDPGRLSLLNFKVLNEYKESLFPEEKFIISIGDNSVRFQLAHKIHHRFGISLHDTAYIANISSIGQGTVAMAMAVVQTDAQIGEHVIINTLAVVEHDCHIGDFVHIGPGAVVCGGATIGEGAFIGANATIFPGITVGKWATVGAGSVVVNNVDDHSKIVGNPARII